jgi:hypothetical protein
MLKNLPEKEIIFGKVFCSQKKRKNVGRGFCKRVREKL